LARTRPLYGGARTVTVDVLDPTDLDVAVLLLVLADLVDGVAPRTGADTGTGNGRRRATSIRIEYRPTDHPARYWDSWADFSDDDWVHGCHAHLIDRLTGERI
jgi:hypothetical protein